MPDTQSMLGSPPVALVFYRGVGLFAALTRWFTRSPFAHCAVRIGGEGSPAVLYEAIVTGVQVREWGRPEDKAATVVVLPDSGEGARVAAFLAQQVGKPYDFLAILLDVLGRFFGIVRRVRWQTKREWTCSRLCAWAVNLSGAVSVDTALPATPGDLFLAVKDLATKDL